jgi:hypothetical protein
MHATPDPESILPEELPSGGPVLPANSGWWHRIGGGSLTISLIIHAFVIILTLLIVRTIMTPPKEVISFLPGGGGGGKSNEARVAQKKRAASVTAPKTRLATNLASNITLPDIQTSMSDFSNLAAATPAGGGIGGGEGGLRGSGNSGLMGNGNGIGFGPGRGNGFIAMPFFGVKIEARRMAVVLDISGSMYPFLPIVIKEVDKIAPGSTVILHYGCGMDDKEIKDPKLLNTTDKSFEDDRIVSSLEDAATSTMSRADRDALIAMVKKRPKTYFVPSSTVGTTWIALLDVKLRDADAIYWFADFADQLSKSRMEEVGAKLRTRKQKLYIHPSNPKWLVGGDPLAVNVNKVDRDIVRPTGGKVVNSEVKKDEPVKTDVPKKKPAA